MAKKCVSFRFSPKFTVIFFAFLAELSFAAKHVAVLETVSEKDVIGRSEKVFLTDKLRDRAKAVLPAYMGYVIMTRANINAMLPPGKSIEECEGSCLVETGKNIAADYVAQARVGKFGKQLTLTVELYETAGNNLVSSFTSRKADAEGLLEDIEREADNFFGKILSATSDTSKENNVIDNKVSKGQVKLDELTDPRDGKKYNIVKIGNQVWMAENINYKPQDGWVFRKSFCYDNNEENCEKYGRYYAREVIVKICPVGWHLPSNTEFGKLIDVAGGRSIAGEKLKSKIGWKKETNAEDSFGFSAIPAGFRSYYMLEGEKFGNFGSAAYMWTSSEKTKALGDRDESYAFILTEKGLGSVGLVPTQWALPVRCIKDEEE